MLFASMGHILLHGRFELAAAFIRSMVKRAKLVEKYSPPWCKNWTKSIVDKKEHNDNRIHPRLDLTIQGPFGQS